MNLPCFASSTLRRPSAREYPAFNLYPQAKRVRTVIFISCYCSGLSHHLLDFPPCDVSTFYNFPIMKILAFCSMKDNETGLNTMVDLAKSGRQSEVSPLCKVAFVYHSNTSGASEKKKSNMATSH